MDRLPSPASICQLPVMTSTDAESIGFAIFNHVPTLPIDIPDGGFTVSAKTSEGLRVTFYFGPSRTGGPPCFIDIQYHDLGHDRARWRRLASTRVRDVYDRGEGLPHLRQPRIRCVRKAVDRCPAARQAQSYGPLTVMIMARISAAEKTT